MKKRIILLSAIVLLGTGGTMWYRTQRTDAATTQPSSQSKVERGSIRQVVLCNGRVVSNLDVDIKCKASGEILKLPFDISQSVKKGDLLMQLDPIDEIRDKQRAESSLAASQARLAQAQQNLKIAQQNLVTARLKAHASVISAERRTIDSKAKAGRVKELLLAKLASPEEDETAQTAAAEAASDLENARAQESDVVSQELAVEVRHQDVALAETQVKSDEISLATYQQRLEDTNVLSPIDGVVSARPVQIGMIISSGITNVGGGTTVLTITDLSHMYVLASVDESDIGKVKLGQAATVGTDAFPGTRFIGTVTRVATKGVNNSSVVTFEVKIEITDPRRTILKPEMTTNVEIIAAEKSDAILAPVNSISRRKGNYSAVVVKDDGTTESRPVKIGISDGDHFEIIEGLQEGETVQLVKETDSRFRNNPNQPKPQGNPLTGGGHR